MALISQAYIPLVNNTMRLVWKVNDKLYFVDMKIKDAKEVALVEELSKETDLSKEVIKI